MNPWFSMGHLYCFLFRCACIIRHFRKCSSTRSILIQWKFVFTFRLKSKFEWNESMNVCYVVHAQHLEIVDWMLSTSWFLDSAIVYRSFVLIQLICSAAVMAVSVSYFDLVWQWNFHDGTSFGVHLPLSWLKEKNSHSSNGYTLTSRRPLLHWELQSPCQPFCSIAILGNWQRKAMKWCPIVYSKWIGTDSQTNCRSISFWLLEICRSRSTIMDSKWLNWTWKLLSR